MNNKKAKNKYIFLSKRDIVMNIISYVISIYLSFFMTYFAIKEDILLFQVKKIIITIILSYFLIIIIRKIFLPKNINTVSIYPINLKDVMNNIYVHEYIDYSLLVSALIIPDIILNKISFLQYSLLMLFPIPIINIEIKSILYNFKKKYLLNNIFINLSILFMFNSLIISLIFNFPKYHYNMLMLFIVIIFITLCKNKQNLCGRVYKYSYNSNQLKESKLKQFIIRIFDRLGLFKNQYLYTAELKKTLLNKRFEFNLARSFIILISVIIFLNSKQIEEALFFDLTILLSAINYFSTSTYYIEKKMYILRDIMPINELELFKIKVFNNTFIWIIIFSPYIIISLYKMKGIFIVYLFFVLSSFSLGSFIGVFIDKLINNDKDYNSKNIYTRFFVIVIAIIYLWILKDTLYTLDYDLQFKTLLYSLLNILCLFFLRRVVNVRISKCYKKF